MVFHASHKTMKAAALAVAAALALGACGNKDEQAAAQAQAQQAPAPEVGVVTVYPQTVSLVTELPGRLESVRTAQVRAQVGGIIEKRLFQEGSYVRAGQPLYQIDSSTYEAALESAKAQLASAEAALLKADADIARYKPLVEADAISRQEFDAAITARRSAEAGVKAARAAIKSAGISLRRSRITAPISGFIGQSNVSEGTLVNAGDATVLATIQQNNPLYVNVTQSATDIMQLRQDFAEGKLQTVNGGIEVGIKFENGKMYNQTGRLLFADPTVNESTGQVTLRAAIPNDDNVLLPGLYVRVLMNQADVANAFVVPQQAVTRGAKDTVMIVNAQGGLEPREVTVAQQQGSNWIITAGLQDGDKVVVDGTMIAGMMGAKKVTPKEWKQPSENAPQMPAAHNHAASEAEQAASDSK
ncbi:efflux RND transporter periplasmic adaptor subunit [Neisseria sp. ZJ106]|uniref:Efflux RND transporter periplasmic adaptor subunit n=1 Tax=Neisseria lisongii TaxID=2912188 RepID=A0ABY7RJK9_9NEIS|nr:efflux RND transporter periplasmic adaptor subunit [Neisseria lisongii]MCF7521594.1 efflux RND transporter periplasmic adaptor subunit [Neisseria lisongii]WCL71804.1 efflux RND transporter periplasmic adaptor subunit [Neisseria lisongii]